MIWQQGPENIRNMLQLLPSTQALDVASIKGGARVLSSPTGDFIGLQNPANQKSVMVVPIFSWLTKPTPNAFQGKAFIADLYGGISMISDGTRWYPEGGHLVLHGLNSAVTHKGTAETILTKFRIPIGLVQPGDKVSIRYSMSKPAGSTQETATQRLKIGRTGIVTDSALMTPPASQTVSGANLSVGSWSEWKFLDATHVQKQGNSSLIFGYGGASNTTIQLPTLTPSFWEGDLYISLTNQSSADAEIYTLHDFSAELITSHWSR